MTSILIVGAGAVGALFGSALAPLLGDLALVGVGRAAPGKVHHQMMGQLNRVRYPNGASAAADKLAAMFKAGGRDSAAS